MSDPLKISLSDLFVLALFYFFITNPSEWSWWYLPLMLFWGRFHIIRKRIWHAAKLKAEIGKLQRKIKDEKTTIN